MKRKLTMFFALFLMGIGMVMAQTQVRGTVVDEKGEPAIGATIQIKGTSQGASTDIDGKFTLSAPANGTLIVSYVGYKTQEVKVSANVRVVLVADSELLDDVIVVAYGTATRQQFTGSASSVKGEKLQMKSPTDVTKALEGEVPGVQVINRSGQPGTASDIVIRGVGSVNSSVSPLYVVDGVPYGASMAGINPSDIESLSVLKDASATALYGARAANGVVLITTKRGKDGKILVDAEVKYGIAQRFLPLHEGITNAEEYMEVAYQALQNKYDVFKTKRQQGFENATISEMLFSSVGIAQRYNMWKTESGKLINAQTGKFNSNIERLYTPEKWADHIFRTGQRQEANLKLSGGSTRANFYTSIGYLNDEGYYIGSDFQRISLRNNVSYILSDNLNTSLNLSYSQTQMNRPGQTSSMNNGFAFVNSMPAIYPVFEYNEKGEKVEDKKIPGGYSYDYGQYEGVSRNLSAGINPAGAIQLDKDKSRTHIIDANYKLEYRFLNDFKFAVNAGYQYSNIMRDRLTNAYYGDASGIGRLSKATTDYSALTVNQILSWSKRFGQHSIDAFAAHETYNMDQGYAYSEKSGAVTASQTEFDNYVTMKEISSYRIGYSLESYFGQVRYDYNNKYFLTGALRYDGSSRFAPDKRWGSFGSIGVAWIASNEDFMKDVSWVNNLKLKASWGLIGNQDINLGYSTNVPDFYLYEDFYEVSNLGDLPAFKFYSKGNSALTWEKTTSINIGLEANFFKRLSLNVDYFVRNTYDMLFRKQVPVSMGYAYIASNDGKLANRGIEIEATYQVLKNKEWNLSLRFNGAHYRNKLTQMPLDGTGEKRKNYELKGNYAWGEGHSIYDFYIPTYIGVDKETGLSLFKQYTYKEKDEKVPVKDMQKYLADGGKMEALTEGTTTDYQEATKDYVGKSALPVFTGGFGFDVAYKNISLSTSFSFGLGGYAVDNIYASMMHSDAIGTTNWHKDIHRAWTPKNKETDVPALSDKLTDYKYASATSTRFLTSRSYLNLSNLRLSYNIPANWLTTLNLSELTVYVSGDNLYTLTARKGYYSGTSISGGTDNNDNTQVPVSYRYLPVANIMGGIQIRF